MKQLLFVSSVFLAISVIGCDKKSPPEPVYQERLTTVITAEARQWILDCIKNGNPMSDEEGEDLVRQCEVSGKSLFKNDKKEKTCWRITKTKYNNITTQLSCDDWQTIVD